MWRWGESVTDKFLLRQKFSATPPRLFYFLRKIKHACGFRFLTEAKQLASSISTQQKRLTDVSSFLNGWRWGESNPRAKRNSRSIYKHSSFVFCLSGKSTERTKSFFADLLCFENIPKHLYFLSRFVLHLYLSDGRGEIETPVYAKANSGEKYGDNTDFPVEVSFATISVFLCAITGEQEYPVCKARRRLLVEASHPHKIFQRASVSFLSPSRVRCRAFLSSRAYRISFFRERWRFPP